MVRQHHQSLARAAAGRQARLSLREGVSPECAFCYAELFNLRNLPSRGTGLPYQKSSTGEVEIVLDEKALEQFLRWERPRKVFWCSMTDLFGEFVPSAVIQRCLDVACDGGFSRGHVSQLLTKRPERMVEEVIAWCLRRGRRVPSHVWLGFSAGDRELFFDRWPIMRRLRELDLTEGPIWCSYEPAIGALVRNPIGEGPVSGELRSEEQKLWFGVVDEGLSWLVVGGESGARSLTRPFFPRWAEDCVRLVGRAGAAIFVKQMGSVWARAQKLGPRDSKAEVPASWPEGCRVRNFPEVL